MYNTHHAVWNVMTQSLGIESTSAHLSIIVYKEDLGTHR